MSELGAFQDYLHKPAESEADATAIAEQKLVRGAFDLLSLASNQDDWTAIKDVGLQQAFAELLCNAGYALARIAGRSNVTLLSQDYSAQFIFEATGNIKSVKEVVRAKFPEGVRDQPLKGNVRCTHIKPTLAGTEAVASIRSLVCEGKSPAARDAMLDFFDSLEVPAAPQTKTIAWEANWTKAEPPSIESGEQNPTPKSHANGEAPEHAPSGRLVGNELVCSYPDDWQDALLLLGRSHQLKAIAQFLANQNRKVSVDLIMSHRDAFPNENIQRSSAIKQIERIEDKWGRATPLPRFKIVGDAKDGYQLIDRKKMT